MNTKTISTVAGVILAAWLTIGLMPMLLTSQPGTFGDMFGAVNALFSGLALAGVVCAILLQREELRLQREELALTRLELHRTAEAQASSAATLEQQYKLAERNTKIQALTALLQSCNQRISHEQDSMSRQSDVYQMVGVSSLGKLYKQVRELERQLNDLLEIKSDANTATADA